MQPIDRFRKDWRADAYIAQLCEQFFCYLSDKSNHLEHYSFSQLKAVVHSDDETRIAQALQYLSSPKWHILQQAFLFFDGDNVYEFSPDEMEQYFLVGAFAHPISGEVIHDLDEIVVAFTPGSYFVQRGNS